MRLDPYPLAVAGGQRLLHLAETVSTMEEAAALVRAGDHGPLWIVADRQTDGRGRLGRPWVSPPGNLHATLLMPAPCPPPEQPRLGFAIGVALALAVDETVGRPGLARLKWPNDVLVDGAKVAGLLVEGLAGGRAMSIGIGVNVASAPEGLAYPTHCLKEFNRDASVRILLMNLSHHVASMIQLFDHAAGFGEVRRLWLERAAGLGERVTVRDGARSVSGRFVDLDGSGRLLLDDGDRVLAIAAGDVFPGGTG
jgi:BirA family biotin operon repressor/biotin-[acetyl-CoA-carboxylase] ligase